MIMKLLPAENHFAEECANQGMIGILPGPPLSFSYTGPTVAIPDGNVDTDGPPVNIPITVSGVTSTIADINFRIDGSLCTAAAGATTVGIEHSYVADLVVKPTSPQERLTLLLISPCSLSVL